MRRRTTRIVMLTVPSLFAVVSFLAREKTPTYLQVDELTAHRAEFVGQPLEVHGIETIPSLPIQSSRKTWTDAGRGTAIRLRRPAPPGHRGSAIGAAR